MNFNKLDSVSPAFLLVVGPASPSTPTIPSSGPVLASAGPPLVIHIEKYGDSNVVNYPSLESYVRQTFTKSDDPVAATEVGLAVITASSRIASQTRRGVGNYVFTGEKTSIPLPKNKLTYMKFETLDFLAPDECLVFYSGNVLDSGFVWMEKQDGTIDVSAQPRVADYGTLIKIK